MKISAVFCSLKSLLKTAGVLALVANVSAHLFAIGTAYTWTGGGDNTTWTDAANWDGTGYPGEDAEDTAIIQGTNNPTITLTKDITFLTLYICRNSTGIVTINTGAYNLTATDSLFTGCESGSGNNGNTYDSTIVINGTGTVTVGTFDFPNYKTHKITINTGATFKITGSFFGNSDSGTLNFDGNGTLYVPASGANLDYGDCKISYASTLNIEPYASPSYYSVTLNGISDFPTSSASITLTRASDTTSATVKYPYTVTDVVGSGATFSVNSTTLATNLEGEISLSGATVVLNVVVSKASKEQNFSLEASDTINEGDGFTIEIYTPDKARVLSTISWYKGKTSWTGNASSAWENTANWILADSSKSLAENLSTSDLTINSTTNDPIITSGDWTVKSLSITANANITMNGGTLTTDSITLSADTSRFYGNAGTVILQNATDASISYVQKSHITFYDFELKSGSISYDKINLSHDLYILGSITFSSNTELPGSFYFATTTAHTFNTNLTAENIVIYSGAITTAANLTAQKDFIIIGSGYNSSSLKYEHFAARPNGWTNVNISTSEFGTLPDGSTVNFTNETTLTASGRITASASGSGNFYLNGAILNATGNIVIPQNDTPQNFCAEAINATINSGTVVCSDGTSDGSKAQIPTEGCTVASGCANFDSTDFQITAAYTVADDRIFVEVDGTSNGGIGREIRNVNGELNNSDVPAAITVSDDKSFTAIYSSKTDTQTFPTGTEPNEIYLYTANTTWNTDASGTSAGSGNYTNSNGVYRTVIPYLVIPQYITSSSGNVTCGYVLTDKWGKRLKAYPSSNPYTNVTDGIPEEEKTLRSGPEFSAVLSAVGSNKICITFSTPIVTDSAKISYYTDADTRITITQNMSVILPYCFEIISIDSAGSAVKSDLQINTSRTAAIETSSRGLSTVTMYYNRAVTLSDIQTLYVRLVSPTSLYDETNFDHATKTTGLAVTFIQESDSAHTTDGGLYMKKNTAHTISDFALGAVTPSYAYTSSSGTEPTEFYQTLYGDSSATVHDFSKNQNNYGTLPYGYEVTLVSKVNTGLSSPSDSDYPAGLRLYMTDSADSASAFTTFNHNFDKSASAWLPALSASDSNFSDADFTAYAATLNSHFWDFESEFITQNKPQQGYKFIISQETIQNIASGTQVNFLFALCDSDGTPLEHYLTPKCTDFSGNGAYDVATSPASPLFALVLPNPADLLGLDLWYFKLKSITEQRGGVTILNNVINSAQGEKTVLKVNLPSSGNLDVIVMTLDGNVVKYLAHGSASAGEHFYYWDGKNKAGSPVARGMYFVVVKASGIDETRKVMVVK